MSDPSDQQAFYDAGALLRGILPNMNRTLQDLVAGAKAAAAIRLSDMEAIRVAALDWPSPQMLSAFQAVQHSQSSAFSQNLAAALAQLPHSIQLPPQLLRVDTAPLLAASEAWKSMAASVQELVRSVATRLDLATLVSAEWLKLVQDAGRRDSLMRAFRVADLWPAPSMPAELPGRVVALHQSGSGRSAIANAVSGRYSRDQWILLDQVSSGWREARILKPRARVLEDAATAMRAGLNAVVVPALVPQVEGITADYLRAATGSPQKLKHSAIVGGIRGAIPDWAVATVGVEAVELMLEFLGQKLFGFVDFEADHAKARSQSILNRHVTVHGRGIRQASRMNGLRAFLMLDVLGRLVLTTPRP